MTSLVTGVTGFLGARTAAALCARDERVRVLVRPTSDRRRLEGLSVEFAEGDVTDRASIEKAEAAIPVVRTHWLTGDHDLHAQHPAEVARLLHHACDPGFWA